MTPLEAHRWLTPGTLSGVSTALWVYGLWYSAKAFRVAPESPHTSRLRDALVLGIAIPGLLGLTGLLTPAACVAMLVTLAIVRTLRARPSFGRATSSGGAEQWRALPLIAILATSWPLLVRPILNGDSLSYHLPLATSWVHAHSLWTAPTVYWWYPGGSELFAAGVFCVGGAFGLPVCGVVAVALLALRCYDFARAAAMPSYLAGALAAVIAGVAPVQPQSGSLENDVWLSAFVLELVWASRFEREALLRCSIPAALIKPVGVVFVAVLVPFLKLPWRIVILSFAGFIAWALRDAVLVRGAHADYGGAPTVDVSTTILAHGFAGLLLLGTVLGTHGPALALVALATIAAWCVAPDRRLRYASLAFAFVYLVEPFGFASNVPQLASGQSLRFMLPSLVLGVVASFSLFRPNRIASSTLALVALAACVVDVARFYALFAQDAAVTAMPAVVAVAGLIALLVPSRVRVPAALVVAAALVAYAGRLAGVYPAGYFDDVLAGPGPPTRLFDWLAEHAPSAVISSSPLLGAVDVISPATRLTFRADAPGCPADAAGALFLITGPAAGEDDVARARRNARSCGETVFADAHALLVRLRG